MYAAAVEAEEAVFDEKRFSRRMVRMTRHDEPVERLAVPRARRTDFFCEDLKQRFVFHRRHGERPFGPVVAEPRALPARHGKRGDPTLPERVFACGFGL